MIKKRGRPPYVGPPKKKKRWRYPPIPKTPHWLKHQVLQERWVISKCTRCREPESDLMDIMGYQHLAFIDKHSNCIEIPEWITQFVYIGQVRVLRCDRCRDESGRIDLHTEIYRKFIDWHKFCKEIPESRKPKHARSKWKSPFTGEIEERLWKTNFDMTETAYFYWHCVIGGPKGLEEIAHGYFGAKVFDGDPVEEAEKMHIFLRKKGVSKKPWKEGDQTRVSELLSADNEEGD